ncbi:hypothetical protein ACFTWR_24050 [Streptomyces nigra]|uniref:hypothetical protein n=1 Tax=Streptomyces nigra TaxID=1827580 RepID=UPI00362AE9F7
MLTDLAERVRISLGFDLVNAALLAALTVVTACRLLLLGTYFRKMGKGAFRALHVDVFPKAGETQDQKIQRNEDWFLVTVRQESTVLVTGSIVLATWAVLFTTLSTPPSGEISFLTRNLLLASSVTLMLARTFFRAPGREISFICTEGSMVVGYTAFALALASILADLFSVTGTVLAMLIAVCVAVRELMEAREYLRYYR